MRKYLTCCLLSFAVALFLGCNTIKKMIGVGDKQEPSPDKKSTPNKIVKPPSEPFTISSKDATNWVVYSLVTLVV